MAMLSGRQEENRLVEVLLLAVSLAFLKTNPNREPPGYYPNEPDLRNQYHVWPSRHRRIPGRPFPYQLQPAMGKWSCFLAFLEWVS